MSKEEEATLESRLLQIHKRMEWIADKEARAAWIKRCTGIEAYGAQGEFDQERSMLLDETEKALDRLTNLPSDKGQE